MNYTKGTWFVTKTPPLDNWKIYIKETFDNPLTRYEVGSFYQDKGDAQLTAMAVNACVSVNPNNPMTVAESTKDMYEALKIIMDSAILEKRETGFYILRLSYSSWQNACKTLAKAESKV